MKSRGTSRRLRVAMLTAGLAALACKGSTNKIPPTSAKDAIAGPRLGAPKENFVTAFGAANDHSAQDQLHFRRCPGSNADEFLVSFVDDRAANIVRQYCVLGVVPSAARREAEAQNYLPGDAVAGKRVTSQDTGAPARLYTSGALGKALPERLFRDCQDQPVPAGTFILAFDPTNWTLAAGRC